MNQFHIKRNCFNGVAVLDFSGGAFRDFNGVGALVFNGEAVFGFNCEAVFAFNGEAVFAFNGGAVSLDSQGCKPLVGIPTTNRKSRSDGIGSSRVSVVAMNHRSPPIAKTVNATAPPFPIQPGTISRGSHPWLSNTIAPRFNSISPRFNSISPRFNSIAPRFKCDAPRFRPNTMSHPTMVGPRLRIQTPETTIDTQ